MVQACYAVWERGGATSLSRRPAEIAGASAGQAPWRKAPRYDRGPSGRTTRLAAIGPIIPLGSFPGEAHAEVSGGFQKHAARHVL
jgi:hypothetical protein